MSAYSEEDLEHARKLASSEYWRCKAANGGKNAGYFTPESWLRLCLRADRRCWWCNKQFPLRELTVEHLVPVSKRPHNAIWAVVPACKHCNASRGKKPVLSLMSQEEFIARLRRYHPHMAAQWFGPERPPSDEEEEDKAA